MALSISLESRHGISSYKVLDVDEVKCWTILKLQKGPILQLRRSQTDRNLVHLASTGQATIELERRYDPTNNLYISAIYCMERKMYPIYLKERALGIA